MPRNKKTANPGSSAVGLSPTAEAHPAPQSCRGCGCTDERACLGGCEWIMRDLCSACCEENRFVLYQILFGHRLAMEELRDYAGEMHAACKARRVPVPWSVIRDDLLMVMHELISRAGRVALVNESVVPA